MFRGKKNNTLVAIGRLIQTFSFKLYFKFGHQIVDKYAKKTFCLVFNLYRDSLGVWLSYK